MQNVQVIKGAYGYTAYGAFTSTLRTDEHGNVTYSNMTADSKEYKRMLKAVKAEIKK